ncbi:MAG TPA: BolA/IbaG family iron-sulfur metabolism protein [Polyangiaceae bacterium]
MGIHLTSFQGSIETAIRDSIVKAIPDAKVEVTGGGGHWNIAVTSTVFDGKRPVEKQRLVLQSIAHLMAGDQAPVHAVDSLKTLTP